MEGLVFAICLPNKDSLFKRNFEFDITVQNVPKCTFYYGCTNIIFAHCIMILHNKKNSPKRGKFDSSNM